MWTPRKEEEARGGGNAALQEHCWEGIRTPLPDRSARTPAGQEWHHPRNRPYSLTCRDSPTRTFTRRLFHLCCTGWPGPRRMLKGRLPTPPPPTPQPHPAGPGANVMSPEGQLTPHNCTLEGTREAGAPVTDHQGQGQGDAVYASDNRVAIRSYHTCLYCLKVLTICVCPSLLFFEINRY